MLKINRPEPDTSSVGADQSVISIDALTQLVRRQKWIIIGMAVLGAGLAALYAFSVTPRYTAKAQLLIDAQQTRPFQAAGDAFGVIDAGMVDSQVEILKSERLAGTVIKELGLLDALKKSREEAETGFSLSSIFSTLFSFLGSSNIPSDYELERNLIGQFGSNLRVSRVGLSYVIDISYTSPSAMEAATVANELADSYITDQLESKYQATRRAGMWMQERIEELRNQALAADRAVQEFKNKNNMVDTGRGLVSDQQLSEVNTQLITARTLVAEATARYQRVQEIIRDGQKSGFSNEVVSDVLTNEVFNRLRSQLLDAMKREQEWSKRYGADHIAVVNLRSEIDGLKRAMFNELSRIAETYKSDLDIAKAREQSLSKSVDNLVSLAKVSGNAQVELRELESVAQSYRTLYDNFLQQFMQATQRQSFPITEARVITDASRPLRPTSPKVKLLVFGGLFLGLMAGAGLAFWREIGNRTFQVPADVRRALDLDCLGVLPKLADNSPAGRRAPAAPQRRVSAFESGVGPLREVIAEPFARFAETLRSVKVTVDLTVSNSAPGAKVIGFTSTLPKEGKSTVSANFAQVIAHGGAKCILVDGDLRNPTLTRRLAPDAKVGLLELLNGSCSVEEVTVVDPLTKLNFIPTVFESQLVHTSEVISSGVMKSVVDMLRQHADYVIIDLSPVAPLADVLASSNLVDGYIYVLEWNGISRDLVANTFRENHHLYDKTIGCLLNKTDVAALRRLEDYGSKYHYYKYYAKYGEG